MWATALLLCVLGRAADGVAPERGAFGEWLDGATIVVPRAALAHLVAAGPVPFEPGHGEGPTLLQDGSGLLGAIGLRAGDRLTLSHGVEEEVASWFGATDLLLRIERGAAPLELAVRFEGRPVDPPRIQLTTGSAPSDWGGEPDVEAIRDVEEARFDRAELVHLVAAAHAVPARSKGTHVGYHLEGPLFDGLDLPDPAASIAGRRLVDDAALFDALDRLFLESEVEVLGADGTRVRLLIEAPAVPPPAGWTIPVETDLEERRLRSGVRLDLHGASVPRAALEGLLTWRGVRRPGVRAEGPAEAVDLFRADLTDVLGIPRDAVVLEVGGLPLARRDEVPAARRILLTEHRVLVRLSEGGVERRFVLRVEGPSLVPPDGWPDAVPPFEPTPMRGVERAGSRVLASRLVLRRLIATLPTSRAFEHRVGVFVGVMPDAHPLWPVLGIPSGAPVVALDGLVARTPEDLEAWVGRLCSVDLATLTWSVGGVEETLEVVPVGPAVPCP